MKLFHIVLVVDVRFMINWKCIGVIKHLISLSARPEAPGRPATVPLYLFYSRLREDNFTTATPEGKRDAIEAKYEFVRTEGYVYPYDPTGRRPALRLYYNQARGDNFTTATPEGKRDAEAPGSGYRFVRIEGYLINEGTEVTAGT